MSNFFKFLALGCSMACLVLDFTGTAHGQQIPGEKVVKADDPSQITDPVMITAISVGGRTVQCGLFVKPPTEVQPVAPFQAGGNWLQTMTITLFNRTNRTIVAGTVSLEFLDTGDCRANPCAATEIHLGQLPANAAYDGRSGQPLQLKHPERPPLDWEPDQSLTVRVGDYMDEVKTNLANRLPTMAVTKVAVHIGPFFFEDGMRWVSPRYSIPDSKQHGKFRDVPASYFPGHRGHNWPPGYDR